MNQTTADLIPAEEIPGSRMNSKLPLKTAGADAGLAAGAMTKGTSFRCARVGADVTPKSCVSRYKAARAGELPYSPCLECAKVLAMIRNQDSLPEPSPTIKPEEIATVTSPAKKTAPTPHVPGAKLSIVTESANPFDGWKKYDPKARYLAQSDDFATLTGSVLQFSSKTTQENGLREFKSVDLHYRDGRIGCVFHRDESGVLKVRPDGNGRVVFSAQGFARAHDVPKEAFRRRSAVIVHGPGIIEVNLKKEVAA